MRQRLKSYVKENTLLCRSVYLIFPKITRINIVFASLNKFLIILSALNTQTQLPGRNIDPLILAMTQQKNTDNQRDSFRLIRKYRPKH